MLDAVTKRRIDACRDILVGKVPDPKSQVEQITIALIYKFMDDMDAEAEELGGSRSFFAGNYAKYGWAKLMAPNMGGFDVLALYSEAIQKMNQNPGIPLLFRDIFKNAYLPYRDPETLRSFLKEIDNFTYDHSERLGDAFEYLLSVLGSQGDAGQFRTPRHIIDFMVEVIDPKKDESVLDPACGTAGFLISAYKYILRNNSPADEVKRYVETSANTQAENTLESPSHYSGRMLTTEERTRLHQSITGYDISPDMVRLSLVNMYLHGFVSPNIKEHDSLTSEEYWGNQHDVILANPPFMTPKGGIKPHKKFSITAKRAELLFVDFILEHLSASGKAGVVVPEGVLFVEQNAFVDVRRKLVRENQLLAVISLPHGVFKPYASVKTHILVIDKRLARKTDNILFIEVNSDGYSQTDTRVAVETNDIPEAKNILRDFKSSLDWDNASEFNLSRYRLPTCLVAKEHILSQKNVHLIGRWYALRSNFEKLANSSAPTARIGDYCTIGRGASPNMATPPGEFTMVVPANERKSAGKYDFDCSATCVPLVSSSGHGKADIKRLHFEEGKFALADTMCCLTVLDESVLRPRYLFEILSAYKDELIVPLMCGATNVTLAPEDLIDVVFPLPSPECQDQIIEGIALTRTIERLLETRNQMLKLLGDSVQDEIRAIDKAIAQLAVKRDKCASLESAWDELQESSWEARNRQERKTQRA